MNFIKIFPQTSKRGSSTLEKIQLSALTGKDRVEFNLHSGKFADPYAVPGKSYQLKELEGKNVINQNIFISSHMDNISFKHTPKFIHAKNLFLHNNSNKFVSGLLNNAIFPTRPKVYLFNDIYDYDIHDKIFDAGLEMRVVVDDSDKIQNEPSRFISVDEYYIILDEYSKQEGELLAESYFIEH